MTDVILSLIGKSFGTASVFWYLCHRRDALFEKIGVVSELNIYPVKSCRGISLTECQALPTGVHYLDLNDRSWMVAKENGDFISQRRFPKMALIRTIDEGNDLELQAPGMPNLRLPKTSSATNDNTMKCSVWNLNLPGMRCGAKADQWISSFLEHDSLIMVFSSPNMTKKDCSTCDVTPLKNVAKEGDVCAFSDLCPYLFTTQESLTELNSRLKRPVTMRNFRPNVVVKGIPKAFDEDNWSEIRVGDKAQFRCLHPCSRCVLTTVDPDSGVKYPDMEPLNTLKSFRCKPGMGDMAFFGVNAAVDVEGRVKVGDPVYILRRTS